MTPAGPIYRVGWRPDPWAPPDWVYATRQGIFGGRYDDPEGQYRVLYANSSRHGCFIETLARFRLSLLGARVVDRKERAAARLPYRVFFLERERKRLNFPIQP
jgi:hypothetical protein